MHTVCSHSDAPLQVVRFFFIAKEKNGKRNRSPKTNEGHRYIHTHTPHRELHTVTSKESELKFEKEF